MAETPVASVPPNAVPPAPRPRPPQQVSGSGRYVWLSSLRAFGVVLVLLYHFFPKLCPGGFIGVDIFFVFSGFLITSLLVREFGTRGHISLASFYRRRLKRLLPAVVATLLVTLPLSMLISEDFRVGIAEQVAAVLGWTTNFYEIANGQSYASQLLPHLYVHTWTLSIEMQFYLLWGAVLAFAIPAFSLVARDGRVSTLRARKLLLILAWGGGAVSWILMQVFLIGAEDPSAAYFNTVSHIFPLLIGSAIGLMAGFPKTRLTQAVGRMNPLVALIICVLALGGITAIAFLASFEGHFVWRVGLLATSLLTALVIVVGRGMQTRLRRHRENPILNYLAERSYSLYLFHWPLFIIIDHVGIPAPASTVLVPLLALAATFAASELSYRFVELPFTSGGKGRTSERETRGRTKEDATEERVTEGGRGRVWGGGQKGDGPWGGRAGGGDPGGP
ncbi:MAG: acyltransferase, partial [Coriobacteriales bacterium]|nr:acyltransferase [Coriobacteriales bacterium]